MEERKQTLLEDVRKQQMRCNAAQNLGDDLRKEMAVKSLCDKLASLNPDDFESMVRKF